MIYRTSISRLSKISRLFASRIDLQEFGKLIDLSYAITCAMMRGAVQQSLRR